jgi:hypothetical protein
MPSVEIARRRGRTVRALCLAVVLACGPREPNDELPAGAVLGGDARALARVLSALDGLPGTPLARGAEAWRTRLSGCTEFVAAAPRANPDELLDAVRCTDSQELPESVLRLRGDGDLVLVLPLGDRGRLAASVRVPPDGSVALRGRLTLSDPGARLLLPGSEEPPGPPVLSAGGTLVHARVRADAASLAALVSERSDADRLFRLRSELFAGAVLDGTWELAAYLPRPGRLMPPVALALGVRSTSAAAAAVEKLLGELEATWPVHRSPFALAGHGGACLLDLRILPELAPCYVMAPAGIVVGWNPESLRTALAAADGTRPGESGGWLVHLDRLARADELLRQAAAPDAPATRFDYGWEKLHVRVSTDAGAWRVEAELAGRTRS